MSLKIIGIFGYSGAGKSSFTSAVVENFKGKAHAICLDDFYLDISHLSPRDHANYNYDVPEAFDIALLEAVLNDLQCSGYAYVPKYDFINKTSRSEYLDITKFDIILVEGLMGYIFNKLSHLFSSLVYFDAPHDVCLCRRLKRDLAERGANVHSLIDYHLNIIRPTAAKYIDPYISDADIVVDYADVHEGIRKLHSIISL